MAYKLYAFRAWVRFGVWISVPGIGTLPQDPAATAVVGPVTIGGHNERSALGCVAKSCQVWLCGLPVDLWECSPTPSHQRLGWEFSAAASGLGVP